MMISRIVIMGHLQGRLGWFARCLLLLLVLAGEGVGDLVHSVLDRTLGLVHAPLVLEALVSGQRAGSFLHAPFCFVDVLVGHELSLLAFSPVRTKPERGKPDRRTAPATGASVQAPLQIAGKPPRRPRVDAVRRRTQL